MTTHSTSWLKRMPWLTSAPQAPKCFFGLEKEGLRIGRDGHLANDPHPVALGSTLTHAHLTTDYSEALLEFVTKPMAEPSDIQIFLDQFHRFALDRLEQQAIWPASMPCEITDQLSVPIAHYGHSNQGMLKHVYRRGLWHRYGRIMQCIAGVHFNFSVADDYWGDLSGEALKVQRSVDYFGAIRNFRRYSWLLVYLFGASPCMDRSFLDAYPKKKNQLQKFDADTYYLPYATSLRMSNLGYQSDAQSSLFVCFNELDSYIASLRQAIRTPYPDYETIGLLDENGQYQQLSTHILQIENEYYSDIRPKRTAIDGREKPLHALAERGVEYLEVRVIDLNPFAPTGLSMEQLYFLKVFMLWCLFKESPKMLSEECQRAHENLKRVVTDGRKPDLELFCQSGRVTFRDLACEIGQELEQLSMDLDQLAGGTSHQQAVQSLLASILDVSLCLSERVLAGVTQSGSFQRWGVKQAWALSAGYGPLKPDRKFKFEQDVKVSLEQLKGLEAVPQIEFGRFLREYLASF